MGAAMSAPRFTIGLSIRDAEPYLRSCLASIFAQSRQDWELLIVDDGSRDASLAMARAISDPRVRVIADGANRGLAARLNQLVTLSAAPYFVRMDADDVMHPDRLAALSEALPPIEVAAVVGSHAYVIDGDNRVRGVRGAQPGRGWEVRHAFIHPTVAAATAWFRTHPYSEDAAFLRCEDAELWCRAAPDSRFLVLERPLLFYREVGVFSLRNYTATQRGMANVVRRHFGRPWPRRIARLAGLELRTAAYRLAHLVGSSDALVRRRSRPMDEHARVQGQTDLERALSVPVPGLPAR